MMKTYPDLFALLRGESEARKLFADLPMYVRTSMNDRPNSINSLQSLQDYAHNLTRGEG